MTAGRTGPPVDIGYVLEAALDEAPDRCALVGRDRRYSYAELDAEADAAAAALSALGVGPGDRVGASLPNDTAVVVAFHGVMRLGAVWVGLNQLLPPAEQSALVDDCGARVYLGETPDQLERTPHALEHIVATGVTDHPATGWWELVAAHRGNAAPRPTIDPEAPAAIAYTSGTTGRPKGVVHSQASLLLPGSSLVAARGYTSELCKGDCLALTILNLLVLSTLLVSQAQGTCVVMDSKDPGGIAEWIRREQITTWNGVPTLLYDLVHDDSVAAADLSSLQEVWSGGAPCPEGLRRSFEEKFGQRLLTTYGLTEAPTVVTIDDARSPSPPGSSGRALPHLQVTITDGSGRAVAAGERGEICIGPPDDSTWSTRFRTMVGYWRQPEVSALHDGVLHTGDVGYLDRDGNLFVVDRKQLVILRGGANVYPAEVEDVLMGVAGVRGCAVLGTADERLGERVIAVLEVDDGFVAPGSEEDPQAALRQFCTERLARYKVPDRFVFCDSLPRNAMGKVRRDVLTEQIG